MEPRATLVLLATALLATAPAEWAIAAAEPPEPEAVLEPGQERAAAKLLGLDRPELAPGWKIAGVELARDRVLVRLEGPGGAAGSANLGASGDVESDPEVPAAVRDAIAARVREAPASLRWRRLAAEVDRNAAAREGRELSARVSRRLGDEDAGAGSSPALPTDLDAAAGGTEIPPPGALSAWLAREGGRLRAPPCRVPARCPAGDIVHALEDEHLTDAPLALWGDEPRVLALSARRAADRDEPEIAASLLWQALAHAVADGEAVALAAEWGWGPGRADPAALPAVEREMAPREAEARLDPVPWLLGAGALLLLALVLARASRFEALVFAAGALLAVALAASLPEAGLRDVPSRPDPDPRWLALGRGGGCELSPPAVTRHRFQVFVRCGDGAAGLAIVAGDASLAHARAAGHSVLLLPAGAGGRVSPGVEGIVRAVALDLARDGAPRLEPVAEGERAGPEEARPRDLAARLAEKGPEARAALVTAGVAAALSLAVVLALLVFALRALGGLDRGTRLAVAAGLGIAAVAHLAAPARMVMVLTGYAQTTQLVGFEPLRYGAGANWLYGPWLALFGLDHAVVQTVNRVYGLLTLVFLAALAARLAPSRPRAVAALALLTAVSPLLWRDHASESILVGAGLAFFAALFAVAEAARRPTPALLVLGAAPALLAALTRPELGLALAPAALLVLVHVRPRWGARGFAAVGIAAAGAALVLVPHAAWLEGSVDRLVESDALPGLGGLAERAAGDLLVLGGLTVVLRHGPALLGLFLLAAVTLARGERLLSLGLALVAFAWMAVTRVDLPPVSIPRVHAPPWTLLALVGSLGAAALLERLPRPRLAAAGLALAWVGTTLPTIPDLYRPTNEDEEERLVREAVELLPEGEVCLATVDYRDPPPPGKTHRAFPYYLLEERRPAPVLTSLSGLDEERASCPDGTYALLGVRCHMHLREGTSEGPPPSGAEPIEACRTFRERFALEPLVERAVPNRGDLAFPMYPAAETLEVGFYRVQDR